jgi:D-lactate dehydrogenase (cytochrome)
MNSLKFFARRVPQATSRCAAPRNSYRTNSTFSQPGKTAFWTSGRVLLLTSFTASLTYLVGISDVTRTIRPWKTVPRRPSYGTKRDMEKVNVRYKHNHVIFLIVVNKAIAELRQLLGEDSISTDDEDLRMHGYSEWSSINIDQLPVAVAYPRSTAEVSQIAKVCHKYKMPMGQSTSVNMEESI